MATKLFLLAAIFITAIGEATAAVRPAESTLEKGSWAFYSREKKSKIAPQPAVTERAITEQNRNIISQRSNSIAPEPLKKAASQASTDSETGSKSDNEKCIRTNEIIRYFSDIADEILESSCVPKVKKRKSLPWLVSAEERSMTEQYYECSRNKTTNRLMRCTKKGTAPHLLDQ